jgi:cyclophilin family peptidyl-prolyl cis-trans isomerase
MITLSTCKRFFTPTALALGLAALIACQSKSEKPTVQDPTSAATTTTEATVKVRLKTNLGDIVLLLDRAKAPVTVDNFRGYVEKQHYDGTVFHRVMDGFMIQGGGFALSGNDLVEKPTGAGIRNEGQNGLKNLRGSIAMARTQDPHSASAQFFINVVDNPMLDYPNNGGYAVFGKVVEGMEVVDKIKAVPTASARMTMLHPTTGQAIPAPAENVPTSPVTIQSATIEASAP